MNKTYYINKGTQEGESFIVAEFNIEIKADEYIDRQRDHDKYIYWVTAENTIMEKSWTIRLIKAIGRMIRGFFNWLSFKGSFQLFLLAAMVTLIIKAYIQWLIYKKG